MLAHTHTCNVLLSTKHEQNHISTSLPFALRTHTHAHTHTVTLYLSTLLFCERGNRKQIAHPNELKSLS